MERWQVKAPNGSLYEIESDKQPSGAMIQTLLKQVGGYSFDADAGPKASGSANVTAMPSADPRSGGATMASRAGAQVLAPKNPAAVLGAMADAGNVMENLPRAVISTYKDYAVGGLKGVGGIADSIGKAIGLRGDDPVADVAFEPSNPVQSVGKGAAQVGTTVLATEAGLAAAGARPLTAFVAKLMTSPAGIGAETTAYDLATGHDVETSLKSGAVATAGAVLIPKAITQIVKKVFPKATAAEVAEAVAEVRQTRSMPAPPAVTPERLKAAVEAGPRGAAAKAARRPPATPAAVPEPVPAPSMSFAAIEPPAAVPMSGAKPLSFDEYLASLPPEQAAKLQAEAAAAVAPGGRMGAGLPAEIRPIPPNKLPPVMPDPVVPEIAGQGKMEGSGANARQWIQDYAAADLPGRQKMVKGLAGKMSYEDMRQLAAYTDDITTVNPGAPPAAVESHFRPVKLEGIERAVPESVESLADTYRAKASKNPDIVTGPHAPQNSFVEGATLPGEESAMAYRKRVAAERGDAPEVLKAKLEANKTEGRALLEALQDEKAAQTSAKKSKTSPRPKKAPSEAFETRVRHATTAENAEGIIKDGFDPNRKGAGLGGDDYGPGVYLADESSDAASFWREQLATKNETGTIPTKVLGGTVKFKKALRMEDLGDRISGPGGSYTGMFRPLGSRGMVAKYLPAELERFDGLVKEGMTPNRALGTIAKDLGYDGMVLDRMRGQEIISFSPEHVRFDAASNKLKKDKP